MIPFILKVGGFVLPVIGIFKGGRIKMEQIELPFFVAPEVLASRLLKEQREKVGYIMLSHSYLTNRIRENPKVKWFVWDGVSELPGSASPMVRKYFIVNEFGRF